jgi:glycosyltransferase involved in cell wall biosynthesis
MPGPHESVTRLRTAIDATPLLGQPTGVGVFTAEVLRALSARGDLDLSAFCVSWRTRHQLSSLVPEGVSTKQSAMPARPLHLAWSAMEHPRIERFLGPLDVVHGTNFTVPPSRRAGRVVTVHDLTCIRFPEMCQPATLRYPRLIERALKAGAVVHTPSVSVAEEVRDHFGAPRDQVVAIHSGIPSLPAADAGKVPSNVDLGRPYVLSIGTAEPRKDLPGLVKAFSEVAQRHADLQLVLVGPGGWGSEDLDAAIAASAARDRIVMTGFVEDAALAAILAGARVLAYPSRYEGFGFPPLQAMAAGVPVVTTSVGALRETCGGAALMVEPGDIDALAEALDAAVDDEARRSILITAGLTRVGDFTWESTAAGLVDLYRRVADR